MNTDSHPFDAITPENLVERGSWKWTRFPGTLPGFVAEMDFPLAKPITEALSTSFDLQRFGYLPQPVAEELKEATADYVSRTHSWAIEPEQIYLSWRCIAGL